VNEEKPLGWGILELMGHRKLGGLVSETTIAGASAIRIQVPGDEPDTWFADQTYSPAAFYCFTPTTEETARAFAKSSRPAPVTRWELPALPGRRDVDDEEPEEDEETDGEDEERPF
jgi:hypothetical protein